MQAIQDKINEEADRESLALIESIFEGAASADNTIRARYPNSINFDHDKITAEVFLGEFNRKVSVPINDDLFKAIRRALFGAIRDKARKVHSDEFIAKVKKTAV